MLDKPGGFFDKRDISPVTIEEEMKRSYLDYAMSVIVSRALPDVRDGLKPVHRRILYGMLEGGYHWNRPFRKSANIVGHVMGNYHPHGDAAIYDAMVRMAQDFSMRLQLVNGQGNFGSMDGDPPAAMRYTEARLAKVAHELLADIDKETVDFQPNYDESRTEPMVLPAKFPNLLVNGAGGIAVGMATNIPPHNLGEVIDGCCAYLDNPDITLEELLTIIPGPDFPTGGLILGTKGAQNAYTSGRGSIIMRARTHFEQIRKDKTAIIVTEIPYQVNKSRLVERIAELANNKTIEDIADLRDESDREGVRIVIELKRDANPDVVLNQLLHYSPLQTSFGVNSLALNHGRPETMTLQRIIAAFVEFREEVITRRTRFDLNKARERAHILVGLVIAVANIDEVVQLIRNAPDPNAAREQLLAKAWPASDVESLIQLIDEPGYKVTPEKTYYLSEEQAKAILDLRLQRLTGLERDKIGQELSELAKAIVDYLNILGSRDRRLGIMREELLAIKEQFATPRKTTIEAEASDTSIEDLIQKEDMVATVTQAGYIKRVELSAYRAQKRGGRGRSGMSIKEEDFLTQVFVANTHTTLLFFSSKGQVYKLKVYKLPLGTPQARGKPIINLIPLDKDEAITTLMPLPEQEEEWAKTDIVFVTAKGNIRRNRLNDFTHVPSNGKIAMKLEKDDHLIGVKTCNDNDDILLATHFGKCIRFPVADLRVFIGRSSVGVRGIRLLDHKRLGQDKVISMSLVRHIKFSVEERDAYLRLANQKRRAVDVVANDEENLAITLDEQRYQDLEKNEEFILTVTQKGYGKQTSAYEYRVSNRGGQGIANIEMTNKNGPVIATFPVTPDTQLVLVTDTGKLIRLAAKDIRIAGRKTIGVTLFRIDKDESVVSVTPFMEPDDEDEVGKTTTDKSEQDSQLPLGRL